MALRKRLPYYCLHRTEGRPDHLGRALTEDEGAICAEHAESERKTKERFLTPTRARPAQEPIVYRRIWPVIVLALLSGCASIPRSDTVHFNTLGGLKGIALTTPGAIEAMSDGIDDLGRPMALNGTKAGVVTVGGYIYAPRTKAWLIVAHELCHADGQDQVICHAIAGSR